MTNHSPLPSNIVSEPKAKYTGKDLATEESIPIFYKHWFNLVYGRETTVTIACNEYIKKIALEDLKQAREEGRNPTLSELMFAGRYNRLFEAFRMGTLFSLKLVDEFSKPVR